METGHSKVMVNPPWQLVSRKGNKGRTHWAIGILRKTSPRFSYAGTFSATASSTASPSTALTFAKKDG